MMNSRNDRVNRRVARVARQDDGAVPLIVRDGGIRILTQQIDVECVSVQPILERAAAVLERHGMALARPWHRHPSGSLHFASAWDRP